MYFRNTVSSYLYFVKIQPYIGSFFNTTKKVIYYHTARLQLLLLFNGMLVHVTLQLLQIFLVKWMTWSISLFCSFGSPMDLTARFSSPLAVAAAAAAAGQNVASASTASSLFPYLFTNRNLHNYWLSTMKGMKDCYNYDTISPS